MKSAKKLTVLIGFFLGLTIQLKAQPVDGNQEKIKYRRSSLHLILIESDDFPRKETVINAYHKAPFPDKYNNHSLEINSLNPNRYTITDAERAAAGAKRGLLANMGEEMLSSATANIIDKNAADIPIITNKFIRENKIANQLVAKWFNRQTDGSFDMKLVGERGSYDATEMQANIAKGSARGVSSLADAGEELIKNTFVVLSKLQFVSNEPIAAAIRDYGKVKAAKLPAMFQSTAFKLLDIAYEKAKEGYSVWTTSYLYRLKWNDSTSTIFYNDMWMDKSNVDPKRKVAFENSDLFQLEYLGSEKSSSLVTFSLKENRTEDQIVELATVRNVESVFAKLQKKYEVFKPKIPLLTGSPITAKIGRKEGLEGGEKFEVLEQVVDEKTGLTTYKRKGTVTVDKKMIWDNRYNAGEIAEGSTAGESSKAAIDRTTFKGGDKYYAGMLLRQIK